MIGNVSGKVLTAVHHDTNKGWIVIVMYQVFNRIVADVMICGQAKDVAYRSALELNERISQMILDYYQKNKGSIV